MNNNEQSNNDNIRVDKIGFGDLVLYQIPTDFCYGIDAVLLVDFAKDCKYGRAVDLGTGNGIVPLILSHKAEFDEIVGVEIQKNAATLAKESIIQNNLTQKIKIVQSDILELDLDNGSFDLVVSNPPYVAKGAGLVNSKESKHISRHETTASLEDFIRVGAKLLKEKGSFCMVHRPIRLTEIITSLKKYNLEPERLRFVSPKEGVNPNIMLIKAIKQGRNELQVLPPLYVYNDDGTYHREIMDIYER